MSLCDKCCVGEYHGFPPKGSPEWEVGTIYFWCPQRMTHSKGNDCPDYIKGDPKQFDKRGERI